MYTVLFHRYDRLGCNLIIYIAQIIYAHYHGYYIKFIDNKYNYCKYPDSKYFIILLNYINNVLNVYYYDPHGTQGKSWSSEHKIYDFLSIFFNDMKISMNNYGITNIILKRYDIMCPIGIQSYSARYDIGMCQIFSSLWLYLVIKIIDTAKEQNISLPETDKWIFLINKYFTTNFNPKQMYNSLLLFISNKYTLFTQENKENKEYKEELEKYIEFLFDTDRTALNNFEISFSPKSVEEIKERDEYLEAVVEKGHIMADINSKDSERIIKNHVIKIINKLSIEKILKDIAKASIGLLKELNDDVKKLALIQFQKGVQNEENEYNILLAIKVIELTGKSNLSKMSDKSKNAIIKALKEELKKSSSKKRKIEETYEAYDERLRKQQKAETYSLRRLIPFSQKKNLYEECNTNEDCLSNFCYHNEITGERNCLIK